MKKKKYSNVKETEIEWLRELPSHWSIKKIKHNTYVKGRIGWKGLRSDEFIDKGPYLVTGTDFINGQINWNTCYHISNKRYEEDPYIQLQNNDLIITKDGTIGKTAIVRNLPDKACLNSGIFVTRPIKNNYIVEFLYWVLNSDVFINFINFNKAGSTISHLYQNMFVEFKFPFPPIEEQQVISNFIQKEISRIDKLVMNKQKQIGLLQEKRNSLINQSVTNGLDPNVKMKYSGIKWLGDIPEHWEIHHLRRVVDKFIDYRGRTPIKTTYGIPLITAGAIKNGFIKHSLCPEYISEENYEEWMVRGLPEKGDVVFTTEAPLGEVAQIIDTKVALAQRIILLKPNKERIISEFLRLHFIGSFGNAEVKSYASGSTALGIRADRFKRTLIPVPPLNEQNKIINYININLKGFYKLKDKFMKSIEILNEYRQALITSAVTGQIDVREEVV